MPAEFTGEQKLRIVLESIIRGVPRDDQCKKYGITPEQFQTWHDHLIKNGGRIYEQTGSNAGRGSNHTKKIRTRKIKYVPWYIKFLLILSIFSNLAAGIVWAVWNWSVQPVEPGLIVDAEPSVSQIEIADDNTSLVKDITTQPPELDDLIEQVDQFGKLSDDGTVRGMKAPLSGNSPRPNLEEMLAPALKLPEPPSSLELGNRVDFIDQTYEAKHVVYLIDAGSYQLKGPNAVERFESMKLSVLESLTKLSANSYFNLVLCWNLRESHALGKTILRANDENKRYATEWITSLGTTPDLLKEGRNQFYPKELLYAQVLPGVVGPWYGLATAMSYDPDVVFFLAGNMPDFSPDEVSRNDFNGLGITRDTNLLANPQSAGVGQGLNSLIRKTAGYWLVALQSERDLPDNAEEIEEIALKRLGIDSSLPGLSFQKHAIPWGKSFDNFLAGLELGISKIPQVYVFQTLQEHTRWPTSLQKSMAEFCESTRGNLSVFP